MVDSCDKEMDKCTFSKTKLSKCILNKRVCEAKAKDENEKCNSKCIQPVDSLLEKCEVWFFIFITLFFF